MKFIRLSFLSFIVVFSSCLKSANDIGGLRTDEGQVVTAITETQYMINDSYNLQVGYVPWAQFSFASPTTESVRFFALHISQPKKKISGSLTVKVAATAPSSGTAVPAGAITVQDIVIPGNNSDGFDFPVKFTVNKALLNPAIFNYAVAFTITSVSQGVISELEKTAEVELSNSKYEARFTEVLTVTDPNNQYGITNNTRAVYIYESAANILKVADPIVGVTTIPVANTSTGAFTQLANPSYAVDATTGKVTATGITGSVIDATSQYTYTANDNRGFTVKYTFPLTTTINGSPVTRNISVAATYTYSSALQAY